jgi:two-component system, OmpR family, sensor histidine kinase VicK
LVHRSWPQRTEVINGRENVMDGVILFVAGARKKIDGCLDKNKAFVGNGNRTIKEIAYCAKRKGIKISYVTEITNDSLSSCKELMRVGANEIRHLDWIKGTFYISDTEYIAPATFHQKGKPASQMIYSNVREIVEHSNTS